MLITLRDYQRETVDSLYGWFRANPEGNPLAILPTGAGKSIILATLVREALTNWPGQRILMLTHVKELIAQNASKLRAVWPAAPLGVHSASLRRADVLEPVIFAGVQSVWKKAPILGRFDLVIVDEAHLINHKAQGMYRALFDDLLAINPRLRVVGLTATAFRTGSGSIMHGDDALFTDVAHEVKMLDLVRAGYLCPLVNGKTRTLIDTSNVATRSGEFMPGQLEAAADVEAITEAALDETQALASDRGSWLIFCAGVGHAEHVTDALTRRGIPAGCVTGQTKHRERDRLIADYLSGNLRALVNMNVLTTGFDAPQTDALIMLRPTKSPGLYVQMGGRGMRVAPSKRDCLVLDFAGNALMHGPIDQVEAWVPKPRNGPPAAAPVKKCPVCGTENAAPARFCSACNYEFILNETPPHDAEASKAPIMSLELPGGGEAKPVVVAVTHARYYRHAKPGKRDSVRADYYNGLTKVGSAWLFPEHSGLARARTVTWWRDAFGPNAVTPKTIDTALFELQTASAPTAVKLRQERVAGSARTFTRILEVTYATPNADAGRQRTPA